PKKLEKWLRNEGYNGNSYKLLSGDMKEFAKTVKEARSKPIPITHDITSYALPFDHYIITKYAEDHKWAKHRKIINPAFNLQNLKIMFSAIKLSCHDMVHKLKLLTAESGSTEVDVWPYIDNLAGDVISRTAFGSNYEEGKKIFRIQKEQKDLLFQMLNILLVPGRRRDGDESTWNKSGKGPSGQMMTIMLNLPKNYGILEAKYMADDASSKKFLMSPPSWKDFKHTLKNNKEELTLVELGRHLRIEESLKVQDSDKPKGNNVAGPQLNIVNDNIALAFMSTSKLNDSILWHARLGDVHFKRIQDMSKDGLIPTFDMDAKKCKTCMLTKITKKPFQNIKRETEVLELIHSDLCDLHATPSLGNKKYFVTLIDDASRFCYVYLLHIKDEALDKFKVFKLEVELQQGSLIKKFRTDKGGEYMDTLYFQSVSIIHEMITPYTPQKNGISERKNRVLKEMVNSMLSYSGLNQGFWGEAMLTTCCLLNRVPTKRNMITPYELLTKRQPNLNYLRVWGCRAVVRLPDPKLKTLGERGIECIFVGYAEHSKAFRFYAIEPNESVSINSIIESRDAIFDDNRFS
ncbi:zinc finger, CCHC-type containing protein, partial [Tanacetum coccineum]